MTGKGTWGLFLRFALFMLAFLAPAGLHAAEPQGEITLRNHCVASAPLSASLEYVVHSRNWRCDGEGHSLTPERTVLRFTLEGNAKDLRYFITRRSPIETVHILVRDADGSIRSSSLTPEQMGTAQAGSFVKAPLPKITEQSREVFLVMDRATHVMMLKQAHLAQVEPGETVAGKSLMAKLAILCGMLLMPMVLNAAFFRILRQPFVLWHVAMTVSLLMTIVFNSGLSADLLALPNPIISLLSVLTLGLAIAAAAMFAHSFIEEDRLHPALRRALPWAACWSLVLALIHGHFPFVGREWQTDAYYIAYMPVLALFIACIFDALRRGSKSARFQAIGWAPMFAVGGWRIVSQFIPGIEPSDALTLFYLGCVFEVVATTFGVTERFMAIKHQRDRAITEAQMLEHLSERDTLTGLYNRRILETDFQRLRSEGFTVMALLDLDHFKSVNDTYGHATGDEVLRIVAQALNQDEDTIIVRMGGEEFAILLRGRNAVARAEHRRNAIPRHVASRVELDRLVTASMGVIDIPYDASPSVAFETVYRHADRLLYEAKNTGRNRMMGEKLQAFGASRQPKRRRTDAA